MLVPSAQYQQGIWKSNAGGGILEEVEGPEGNNSKNLDLSELHRRPAQDMIY